MKLKSHSWLNQIKDPCYSGLILPGFIASLMNEVVKIHEPALNRLRPYLLLKFRALTLYQDSKPWITSSL